MKKITMLLSVIALFLVFGFVSEVQADLKYDLLPVQAKSKVWLKPGEHLEIVFPKEMKAVRFSFVRQDDEVTLRSSNLKEFYPDDYGWVNQTDEGGWDCPAELKYGCYVRLQFSGQELEEEASPCVEESTEDELAPLPPDTHTPAPLAKTEQKGSSLLPGLSFVVLIFTLVASGFYRNWANFGKKN